MDQYLIHLVAIYFICDKFCSCCGLMTCRICCDNCVFYCGAFWSDTWHNPWSWHNYSKEACDKELDHVFLCLFFINLWPQKYSYLYFIQAFVVLRCLLQNGGKNQTRSRNLDKNINSSWSIGYFRTHYANGQFHTTKF